MQQPPVWTCMHASSMHKEGLKEAFRRVLCSDFHYLSIDLELCACELFYGCCYIYSRIRYGVNSLRIVARMHEYIDSTLNIRYFVKTILRLGIETRGVIVEDGGIFWYNLDFSGFYPHYSFSELISCNNSEF